MPRNRGTSRKGKPGKHDRLAGMGQALQKATSQGSQSRRSHGGGMMMSMSHPASANDSKDDDRRMNNNGSTNKDQQSSNSILEMNDVDDFLNQARLAQESFRTDRQNVVLLDAVAMHPSKTPVITWADEKQQQKQPKFVHEELSVPRRPKWNSGMSKLQLETNEERTFIEWRRQIALLQLQQHGDNTASSSIQTTPFEKNLNVWRQLWRVLERSSVILQIIDARNPKFYVNSDLYKYANIELHKPCAIIINKSDYLSPKQRIYWKQYFITTTKQIVFFFSAHLEQQVLDQNAQIERRRQQQADHQDAHRQLDAVVDGTDEEALLLSDYSSEEEKDIERSCSSGGIRPEVEAAGSDSDRHHPEGTTAATANDPAQQHYLCDTNDDEEKRDTKAAAGNVDEDDDQHDNDDAPLLTRQQLIDGMIQFANNNASGISHHRDDGRGSNGEKRNQSSQNNSARDDADDDGHNHEEEDKDVIEFGMVGFPNVGKSSVINVLMGSSKHEHGVSRVGVARQPGKTKHFQTLLLPDHHNVRLCDCPGLVFPSLVSHTADLIAAGVYPIAQMRDFWPVMDLICQRIPREILNATYSIRLPTPIRENNTAGNGNELPPPTAQELLDTYCHARSMYAASSGVADHQRAARVIVQDYATGKLLYCHAPPDLTDPSTVSHFYQETIRTALNATRKVRERLEKQQQKQQEKEQRKLVEPQLTKQAITGDDYDDDDDDAVVVAVDDDLLELIGASAPDGDGGETTSTLSTKKKNKMNKKGKTPKQKWGKKDRKNRNKDPYGCYSTPDGTLFESNGGGAGGGVVMNAGRYTHSGYTRPTTYPDAAPTSR